MHFYGNYEKYQSLQTRDSSRPDWLLMFIPVATSSIFCGFFMLPIIYRKDISDWSSRRATLQSVIKSVFQASNTSVHDRA